MASSSDIAFTPTVKALQAERGSRRAYARLEEKGGWATTITDELAEFLAEADSVYLASANGEGQPYIQHRGGPPGFLRVLDERTLGFADFTGNRQYISTGNFSDNPKAFLFVMDYMNRRRVKIWGTAKVVATDEALMRALALPDYDARVEQAIVFTVAAWDVNCPKHIPVKIPAELVARTTAAYEARIAELEAQVAELKGES
ncbi:MAG: pyridoxamine 5'-phosphate oxidase family protein [Rhodovibrionaceae bacterium]|nr:pyridoxamine 5'-phosphate oxidase family protein [Rhodovibrionaceae bacterium]